MPLLAFWKSNREAVLKMSVEQIVASAGDGNLRDNNECSQEFRSFISMVQSEYLAKYARHCFEAPFPKSGLVLQDIINELGRRLDFEVENGLYQGRRDAVGFDGIWTSEGEPSLIIEVKTTDYVTVHLEKLAKYRERLTALGKVTQDASILIIVGREDTGALEAQIRGSRYAWDMRLISIEGLIKLVQIKEKSDDSNTILQIRQLLRPFEYTKVDQIINVIFITTVDVEAQQVEEAEQIEGGCSKKVRTEPQHLNAKRLSVVEAFSKVKSIDLVQKTRTLFWSVDKYLRVCCAVSKRYEGVYQPYWYAYHPKWDEFLKEAQDSYFILSCMDSDIAYAIPYSWMASNKKNLNKTDRGEGSYWHVALTTLDDGLLAINVSRIGQKIPLEPFSFVCSGLPKKK